MLQCENCKQVYPDEKVGQPCETCGHELRPAQVNYNTFTQQLLPNSPDSYPSQSGVNAALAMKIRQFQQTMLYNFGVYAVPVFCPICSKLDCGGILYMAMRSRIVKTCRHYPERRWIAHVNIFNGIEVEELLR
ncbi:MAG: hypothetical protein ABII22_04650 [Candidatus Micrarchaeota archaeon]